MSAARLIGGGRGGWPVAVSATALLALGGCATFGGNVRGSFSCNAPDGICAPTSQIDDRALAMITGEAPAAATPAGPYSAPPAAPGVMRTAATPLDRSQDKVLRIVFPAYVDDRGRLHEASAIRAVVETGRWRQAVAAAAPVAGPLAAVPGSAGASLAEAVDRADPPLAANADPEMPSHEAVAAARAKLDPIAAIKADVATRVATRPSRQRSRGSSAPTRAAAPSARPVARPPAGPEAQQLTAREASPPTARPVVRASNFPAAVTEER
ncbi:conjugal transfer protein TraV [Sphingomonas sp. 67-36]|uniref:conjugal transfer protein TraV n=1 Tax=Sphingomonas sp. 67-36 TaxID=1895849 RepID=UPI0025E6D545|nr:conjugal transfer protein TraV [Sphingomonas sp. 67-36]